MVVVGGFGLAIASIVPWYQVSRFAVDRTRTNGWQEPDAFLSQAATIVGVAAAVAVLVVANQHRRPRIGSLSFGTALTVAGAVAFGLVALKFSLNLENTTVGVYLALVAAATELYGAYVTRLTESPAPFEAAVGRRVPAAWPAPPATDTHPSGTLPSATASPARTADEAWPETGYLLSDWLRPGQDPAAAVAGYRQAFAGDPARLDRLVDELRSLLDPAHSEADRTTVIAAHAPHLVAFGATAVLEWLCRAVGAPPER